MVVREYARDSVAIQVIGAPRAAPVVCHPSRPRSPTPRSARQLIACGRRRRRGSLDAYEFRTISVGPPHLRIPIAVMRPQALPPVAASPDKPADQIGLRLEKRVVPGRKRSRPKVAWRPSGPRYIHAPPRTGSPARQIHAARPAAELMNGGSTVPAQAPSNTGTPTAPSTCDARPVPAARPRSPWPAVDTAKIREVLAHAAASTRGSSPTPAMDFGRYVRREVDATPAWNRGASAIAKLLRLDPHGEAIERLEAADEHLLTRVAALEVGPSSPRIVEPSRSAPATKSRRGRSNRAAGLDCTGQMLTVLREDSRAAVFTGRMWEERLKERFGEEDGFCRKTVEYQPLYKKQLRPAVVAAIASYGPAFEADFLEHGLELWTHKPGRGDKRKDHTEKEALAGRVFLAALENILIEADR